MNLMMVKATHHFNTHSDDSESESSCQINGGEMIVEDDSDLDGHVMVMGQS